MLLPKVGQCSILAIKPMFAQKPPKLVCKNKNVKKTSLHQILFGKTAFK